MADRLDTQGATIPPPTAKLLEEAARNAYTNYAEATFGGDEDLGTIPKFHELPDEKRDRWLQVARDVYSAIARAGGARTKAIRTPV